MRLLEQEMAIIFNMHHKTNILLQVIFLSAVGIVNEKSLFPQRALARIFA